MRAETAFEHLRSGRSPAGDRVEVAYAMARPAT
jgi:hypothetical protein